MENYVITNGKIVLKDRVLTNNHLVVKKGMIVDITTDISKYRNMHIVDATDLYVSPGFIEMHLHGCGKYNFSDLSENELQEAISFLKRRGINTFVPTFQCDMTTISKFLNSMEELLGFQKNIAGIYIEGPFINIEKKGGILEETIKKPNLDILNDIIIKCKGHLKLMTLAPEKTGSREIVDELIKNDIIPCWGHTNGQISDIPEVKGKTNITHLFNAMSPISHKDSGMAIAPFLNRSSYFELIADGVHVNDEMLKASYNYLNRDRTILISDAAVSAGLEYGEYTAYSKQIVSNENGVRYKDNNVLIGSNLLVNDILKRYINTTDATIFEAIKFITHNPSKLLGIDNKKGSIEVGKQADIVLLDKEYSVVQNLVL